jgi:hypothetical protein
MPPLARQLVDSNAVAILENWINSLPGTPAQAPPSITPNGGSFLNNVSIGLAAPDLNAAIYYTLDGTPPTTNSRLYSNAFDLTSNAIVSASAFRTGYVNSMSANASFFVSPVRFTSQGFSNGVFQLQFLAVPGSNYVLEASTNMINWMPLATNPATTNLMQFADPNSSNYLSRFYRFLQQ